MFPGFDGLMTLSRREGIDIRPTLLRVLTDLYVQTSIHTPDEERQFVELASRLIDEVDDATRAAVRARLSIYPRTPPQIMAKLLLREPSPAAQTPLAAELPLDRNETAMPAPSHHAARTTSTLTMNSIDAAALHEMFLGATPGERALILHNLDETPLKPAGRIDPKRAARAIETLEQAAFAVDTENFARELGDALILPARLAQQIVTDPSGEPLACAAKAIDMPSHTFQRVLLFLNPEFGSSVANVYRVARLYDILSERSARIMLAAWRGASVAVTRAKYRPALYDDERNRARLTPSQTRTAAQPHSTTIVHNTTRG